GEELRPPPRVDRVVEHSLRHAVEHGGVAGAEEADGGHGNSFKQLLFATNLPGVSLRPDHPSAAFLTSSISLRTVFQFRAELTTPMPLSNFSPSFDLPNPAGVCR